MIVAITETALSYSDWQVRFGSASSAVVRDDEHRAAQAGKDDAKIESWILEARHGSSDAFGELVNSSRAYLCSIASRAMSDRLRGKLDVSDLFQETALAAQQSFSSFRGRQNSEWLAWLRQILLHQVSNANRRFQWTRKRDVRREQSLEASPDLAFGLREVGPSAEEKVLAAEQSTALQECIQRLPPRMRLVITMRHEEQLTFRETGSRLQCSGDAARKLWKRAINQLRREIWR